MFSQLQGAVENPPFFWLQARKHHAFFSNLAMAVSVITRMDYFDWLRLQLNVKTSHKFQSPEAAACFLHGSGYGETSAWECPLALISDADVSLTLWFQLFMQRSQWIELWTPDSVGWLMDGQGAAVKMAELLQLQNFLVQSNGAPNSLLFELPIRSVYLKLSAFQSIEILHWIRAMIRLPVFFQLYCA